MENQQLRDLDGNPANPRRISEFDFNNLRQSIQTYGDLSAVVYNQRLKRFVTGHQRREAFISEDGDNITITQRFESTTPKGTVALGYITLDGEQFPYRVVDWPESIDLAAALAANRIQGEWNLEKLGELDQWLIDNAPEWLEKTGQSNEEIQRLLGNTPEPPAPLDDDMSPLKIKLTKSQYDTVDQAIQLMKSRQSVQNPINTDNDGNAIFLICQEYLATPAHAPTT